MTHKCKYIVSWFSAVTRSKRDGGFGDKASADKAASALKKEGAKDVKVFEYKPCKIY